MVESYLIVARAEQAHVTFANKNERVTVVQRAPANYQFVIRPTRRL